MARVITSNITSNTKVHAGSGAVISLIMSHSEGTTQTVTLYDNIIGSGTILSAFKVAPEASPSQIVFPSKYLLRFSTGLYIVPGNCTVIVQSSGD